MKNPYTCPWERRIIAAFLRRSALGESYHPTKAARIATRYADVLERARVLDGEGQPAQGSFWQRLSTGSIWRVYHNNARGLVELCMCRPPTHEYESFEQEDFFRKFKPV